MRELYVRDVMLCLDDVPTIHQDATLAEAVSVMDEAQRRRPPDRSAFRAVLVTNERGQIVGKLGHLAFLKGVDPGHESQADLVRLDRAGVDPELIDSLSDNLRFWQDDLEASCRRGARLRVGDVMRPVDEAVGAEISLSSAISTMVRLQTLSLPVREGGQVVGLLRLADVYDVVAEQIRGVVGDDTERG